MANWRVLCTHWMWGMAAGQNGTSPPPPPPSSLNWLGLLNWLPTQPLSMIGGWSRGDSLEGDSLEEASLLEGDQFIYRLDTETEGST